MALEIESFVDKRVDAALMQQQRHFIDGRCGRHGDDRIPVDIAEEGNFFLDIIWNVVVGAANDDIWLDTCGAELAHALLGWFGLQLAGCAERGQQGDMNEEHVIAADFAPHLANRFEIRLPLDIAHRAADFDDDHIRMVLRGGLPNALLDLVGDMRE